MIFTPKEIFIIDGVGALLSAFLLGVVLVHSRPLVGIPKDTLYILAVLPGLFTSYDLICYFFAKEAAVFIKGIAIVNLLYCLLSLVMTFMHRAEVTKWGWLYIIVEVIVILSIARAEWQVGRRLSIATA